MNRFLAYISSVILIIVFSLFFILRNEKTVDHEFGRDNPEGFSNYMRYITGTPTGNGKGYKVNYRLKEFYKAIDRKVKLKSTKSLLNWVERGPGNVSGRTRALIVDPTDPSNNTWFAGSVSGGIWRTTDAGQNWEKLTEDIPILSTSTLAMAESNPDVLYAGTGEGFGGYGMVVGSGIFKSAQHGDAGTWQLLESTRFNEDFKFVNRIIVDYESEDTVLACTNTGIFKSVDGGENWYEVYKLPGRKVQHIIADPNDFNIIYAGVNTWGVIKSTDKGETWLDINKGIGEGKRFELAISPINKNKIFASVEGYGNRTIVYYSFNSGETWHRFLEKDGGSFNFLRSQGWFDNTIVCHPYDEDIIYVGGVYMGKFEFSTTTEESEPQVLRVDTFNTGHMIDFMSFGGRHFNGGLAIGSDEDGEDLEEEDWRSVEIRLGSAYGQKAHRFLVPEGSGAGVPSDKYNYTDYVDVPFEVWDTDNNTQLMVSFRDNERDGEYNLLEFDNDEPSKAREYFFVHGVPYDADNPNPDIAQEAGYTYKLLYFFWPALQPDSIWNLNDLDGKIVIQYGKYVYQKGTATSIADDNKNKNLHVDHHQLLTIKTDEASKSFILLNSNDGGLGISYDEGNTWKQIADGYNTTQFYGVAKKPGINEYIGGMQDNGTWQSKKGIQANNQTEYFDRLEGDGFEVLWHPEYPQRIIGSTYSNYFSVTNNGGEDWENAFEGINGDGPFVSRLAHSLERPNIIFAVGGRGVYRHFNFALGRQNWQLIRLEDGFSVNDIPYTHDVEVSLANPNIVWAGTGMYKDPEIRMFVSTDGGNTFDSTSIYMNKRLGFSTSIATHPEKDSTAFVMFSLPEKPKILRTDDLGRSWSDISGFRENDTSNNGFPDVIAYTLLVHPEDTGVLWAGTEIGLFESTNSGETWEYADNGLPAVSIFQLKVIDGQVMVATHGRGIWTLDLSSVGVKELNSVEQFDCDFYPNPVSDMLSIIINEEVQGSFELQIINLEGKTVYKKIFTDNNASFNIEHLINGSYILRIKSEKGVYQNKLIKN